MYYIIILSTKLNVLLLFLTRTIMLVLMYIIFYWKSQRIKIYVYVFSL